jgi:hypothetical protein
VAVERWLKGGEGQGYVHHEVWSTFACDTSSAHVGERAMLFLCRNGEIARSSPSVQSAVQQVVGTDEIYRSWNWGDGILPVLEEGGVEYVPNRVMASGVDVGSLLENGSLRTLTEQIQYVQELLRFSPGAVSVLAQSGCASYGRNPGTFDLRILPSGEVRLATNLGPGESVRTFELEPYVWRPLDAVLVGGGNRAVGETAWQNVRKVVLRIDDSTLSFTEPRGWAPAGVDERLALHDALRAWTLVRDVAELPDADPHAEKDRRWLASWR